MIYAIILGILNDMLVIYNLYAIILHSNEADKTESIRLRSGGDVHRS